MGRALAAAAVALAVVPAGTASATSPFRPCYRHAPVDCAVVPVPLDRSGRVPGTVPLHVLRLRARKPSPPGAPRNAVVGLAGGPGQSALPFAADFAATIAPALKTRDLLVFDQRGTGFSGRIRCGRLEHHPIGDHIEAVRTCGSTVGDARAFYRTSDSADDIEAVRRAAGVDKVIPYGTSYGTKVSLAYAQRYPQQTEALVLDSLVDLDGPDPYYRDTFQAVPRVLRELCASGRCNGITADPVMDLDTLVKRIERGSLRGFVVGGDGRRRSRHFGRTAIFSVLLEGDFDPTLRSAFPAAVRAALAGDSAPMLRLANRAQVDNYFPDPPRVFSPGLYATTTCEDGPLPWDPALAFGSRWQVAFSEAQAMPDTTFSPFDRALARANDTLRLCAPWPASGPLPAPDPRPLPDVPTLILGGAADLRTPDENDRALAARLPHASVVVVPTVGHSVLDSDLSGCADEATRAFFAGRRVPTTCSQLSRFIQSFLADALFPPTPVPPRSLTGLATPRRLPGRVGRTVRAAELTFFDAIVAVLGTTFADEKRVYRIGGLRSGRLIERSRPMRVRLEQYSYVPGVWVSGRLGDLSGRRLHLRVAGRLAARGRLTFRLKRDLITGRLGGRRIRLRLTREIQEAVGGLYQLRSALRRHPLGLGRLGRCCYTSQLLPPR
jgi:pimeloyl-ACP methyl ester carboxylesterase